jgi:hypothetical protein
LVELSDPPLPIRHAGAPVQQGFSKVGIECDENLMERQRGGLQVLQELEQLPAELVQVDSVLVVDGTIGVGTHQVQF